MKFAPIVPINYLNRLASLSHYHLCLAQWFMEPRYVKFYKKMVDRGDYVILDNGACELGTSVPASVLLDCFEKLGGCSAVVLPDSGHGNNLELYKGFIESQSGKFKDVRSDVEFMAVPYNEDELELMLKEQVAGIMGLSKLWFSGRGKIIEKYPEGRYHILGVYRSAIDEVNEITDLGLTDKVLGMDSSFIYRLLRQGRWLDEARPYPELMDMKERSLSEPVIRFIGEGMEWFINWVENK